MMYEGGNDCVMRRKGGCQSQALSDDSVGIEASEEYT